VDALAVGVSFGEVVVEEVQQLDDLLREVVVVRAAAAQGRGRCPVGAGARPGPRSIPPPTCSPALTPNG
ncbi:hypothetical protein, partial [Streptomyces pharetrae]|uniref:hypothetical protein n=1 Tax=Streptomyces pharetrae TaxID=291370 RepID=UPI0036BC8E7C